MSKPLSITSPTHTNHSTEPDEKPKTLIPLHSSLLKMDEYQVRMPKHLRTELKPKESFYQYIASTKKSGRRIVKSLKYIIRSQLLPSHAEVIPYLNSQQYKFIKTFRYVSPQKLEIDPFILKKILKAIKLPQKVVVNAQWLKDVGFIGYFSKAQQMSIRDVALFGKELGSINYTRKLKVLSMSFKEAEKRITIPFKYRLPKSLTGFQVHLNKNEFPKMEYLKLHSQLFDLAKLELFQMNFKEVQLKEDSFIPLPPKQTQKNLQSLLISFDGCSGLGDKNLPELMGWVQQQTKLTFLNFSLANMELSKKALEAVFNSVGQLKNLKYLILSLPNIKTTHKEVILNANQMLQKLKQLLIFELDLTNWAHLGAAETFSALKNAFYKTTYIKRVKLNFPGIANISEDSLIGLSTAFKESSNLQRMLDIELNLDKAQNLSDDALWLIGGSICFLQKLKKMKISFQDVNFITDKGVRGLAFCFNQLLALEWIHLIFSKNKYLTKYSFELIFNELKNNQNLKDLILDFGYCDKIPKDCVNVMEYVFHIPNVNNFRPSVGNFTYNLNPSKF